MKYLFMLRGSAGCGKSTFIKKNHLEAWTISPDEIRTMLQCPVLNTDGKFEITNKNDDKVWKMVKDIMENKMSRGEMIIVDATHYRKGLIDNYKKLIEKYHYRPFIVDFTNVPLETTLARNAEREDYKVVPEEVILKMYAYFKNCDEISKKYTIISPQQFKKMLKEDISIDYNKYDKIYIFGDIHGCYEPLRKFFALEDLNNKKNAYIFCGDYIDRGIQNKQVLQFIIDELLPRPNVLLLEGNHEKWLRLYAEGRADEIRSKEFINYTLPQITRIDKKDIRQLCRRLSQMAYIKFRGKKIFVSHGGVPVEPSIFIPTEQLIKGTGKYEEIEKLYESWNNNTKDTILVHGHRNNQLIPAKVNERIYNLCSEIEFGDNLRILEIDGSENKKEPEFNVVEVLNDIYDVSRAAKHKLQKAEYTMPENHQDFLEALNDSEMIIKKDCENDITSYNFSRSAFHNKKWNGLTIKARGLFVKNKKVVARSYDKFFNIDEMPETKMEALEKLAFPVTAYKKENGFLGIISGVGVFSKTTNNSPHVDILTRVAGDKISAIQKYAEEHNCSLVFECVAKDDPHIIRYNKEHLYLLDIIDNSFEFNKQPYEEVRKIAKTLGLECKAMTHVFKNWTELKTFIENCKVIFEGFVMEDSKGFMFKLKSPYYKFWKRMRWNREAILKHQEDKIAYESAQEVEVVALMKKLQDLEQYNILQIQNIYYQ